MTEKGALNECIEILPIPEERLQRYFKYLIENETRHKWRVALADKYEN